MKALLVNSRGQTVGEIALPNCAPTPKAILHDKQVFINNTDGFIYIAEPFFSTFPDHSEVLYDSAGRIASSKDRYGNVRITAFQVPIKQM